MTDLQIMQADEGIGHPRGGPPNMALPFWRRALIFGTGFGIAIGEHDLEAAIVRARPSGPTLIAATTIRNFRNRPAAEWGAELLKFVEEARETRLAATLLLPRGEVVVRSLNMPGVADKDITNAIDLQIDTFNPSGEAQAAWGWSRAGRNCVVVGLAQRELLDSYETHFAAAGISTAAVTFSTTVIRAALRLWSVAPPALLCFNTDENSRTEIYGESEWRSVFSAEFPMWRKDALAIARAELLIAPDLPAMPLSEVLPHAPATELTSNALAYAAAVAGSAPGAANFANLLPKERRASHDRMQYLIPAIMGILAALALLTAFAILPAIEQKRYRDDLDRAAHKLEPRALRAQALERKSNDNNNRILLLDEIRGRPQADLEVLNELTRLLPPKVWINAVEIYPDSVVMSGEADQAEPLLKILDSSPLFQNSEFALSVTRTAQTEQFRIKTARRGRVGRTTP
jgi:hypothetical protein